MKNATFHLALPCNDLKITRDFYQDCIGAQLGRFTASWIDVNLYGNQITFTKAGDFNFDFKNYRLGNQVLPSFHFGVIIDVETWGNLYANLSKINVEVTTETTFLKKKVGEHLSFFVKDPNGYMVEFKSFMDSEEIFSI